MQAVIEKISDVLSSYASEGFTSKQRLKIRLYNSCIRYEAYKH